MLRGKTSARTGTDGSPGGLVQDSLERLDGLRTVGAGHSNDDVSQETLCLPRAPHERSARQIVASPHPYSTARAAIVSPLA